MATIYDKPTSTVKGRLKPGIVDDGGGLTCFSYGQFAVKQIDSGTPSGDVSVTVVPMAASSSSTACSTAPEPGQIVIKEPGRSFGGVKGNFLLVSATDPNGSVPFTVYDRRTGKARYSDSFDGLRINAGLEFIADEDDTLHLRFTRGVNTSCSIPKDGQACWAKIAREAHFSQALASLPAPVAICTEVYRKQDTPLDDPSIVVYDVDLTVPPQGSAHVLSRGSVSCEPLP